MRANDKTSRPDNLQEFRIRASRLKKELNSAEDAVALRAAERFRTLPAFQEKTAEQIAAARAYVQRKHALAVIATEAGFESWAQLRCARLFDAAPSFDTTRLFQRGSAGFLNLWFRSYEEARPLLAAEPRRYLFPHGRHFFLCEALFLENAGVDPSDPDWERIGRDWVRPSDTRAQARLAVRLRRAIRS
jgi:DNA-binding phage protein